MDKILEIVEADDVSQAALDELIFEEVVDEDRSMLVGGESGTAEE